MKTRQYIEEDVTYVLAVCPLLAIDLEVPGQGTLEERLLVSVLEVDLLVVVALPIGSDLHDGLCFWAAEDEDTGDDGVVGGTEDTNRAEKVFARTFQAV